MPKFAANLTMLFQEAPFLERFKLAANAGFNYVEFLFPYAYSTEELQQCLKENQLQQVLFNMPPGNWEQGERGITCLPDRVEEFKEGVKQAITYAKALDVKKINCLAGLTPNGTNEALLWQTMINNVQYAADELAKHELTLLIEPINSKVDMPGFFIDTLDKALRLLDLVDRDNVKLQYDLYHMQIMHGDLLRNFQAHQHRIGHIQFADNPGRHQPGTGEINFANVFNKLDELNYQGWASAEYIPDGETSASLAWLKTFN